MFVTDNDFVEAIIYYKKSGHNYLAYTQKEFEKLNQKEVDKPKYSKLSVKMFSLNWGMYNALQEEAMVDSGNGDRQFNFKVYKENRLKKLIKEWDAKKEDKPVPVNEKTLSMLSPAIAECILRSYDEESMLSEEESGKS